MFRLLTFYHATLYIDLSIKIMRQSVCKDRQYELLGESHNMVPEWLNVLFESLDSIYKYDEHEQL